jgi:excisionase family DNA binding protein
MERNLAKESEMKSSEKIAILKQLEAVGLGQYCPKHYPRETFPPGPPDCAGTGTERLGRPLNINQVAELIGCSSWTVRQRLIKKGLPFFRSGTSSKLIFYEAQVVAWIERQQKGG